MTYITYVGAICCVIGLSAGQVLFKFSAQNLSEGGAIYELKTVAYLLSALVLYGITSIAWVYILQKIELAKVYPLMALAFVFVPIGSFLFFDEEFTTQYSFGVFVIVLGIITCVTAK